MGEVVLSLMGEVVLSLMGEVEGFVGATRGDDTVTGEGFVSAMIVTVGLVPGGEKKKMCESRIRSPQDAT